jgi:glycerate 2-kinase
MRYLIASDKFKGTLTAHEACEILANAVRANDREAEIDLAPIADGGEGTSDILASEFGAKRGLVATNDAVGRPIFAEFFLCENEGFFDMSSASGLWRIADFERRPLESNTFGTGLIVRHLYGLGATRISIGLGGSATVDAGIGLASALGYQFFDKKGDQVSPLPLHFEAIDQVIPPDIRRWPEIVGLADVETQLVGKEGSIEIFGPQKGLKSHQAQSLDRDLVQFVDRVEASLGTNHSRAIRSGAAGGLGYGILAFLNGRLVSGFAEVARRLKLSQRISVADVVITGEGKLDRQSLYGKGPLGIAEITRRLGKTIWVIAGSIEDREQVQKHFDKAVSIVGASIGFDAAMRDPAGALGQSALQFWQ